MTTAGLTHIGALFTGIPAAPALEGESLLIRDGRIAAIGAESRVGPAGADVVVDCRGTTVMPGRPHDPATSKALAGAAVAGVSH